MPLQKQYHCTFIERAIYFLFFAFAFIMHMPVAGAYLTMTLSVPVYGLMTLYLFCVSNNYFGRKNRQYLICALVVITMYSFGRGVWLHYSVDNTLKFFWVSYQRFVLLYAAISLFNKCELKIIKYVVYLVIAVYTFCAITSLYWLTVFPDACRALGNGNTPDDVYELYKSLNILGFQGVYAIALSHSILPCMVKNGVINKYLGYGISILWIWFIIQSAYALALLIMIASISMYVVDFEKLLRNKNNITNILIIAFICFFFAGDFLFWVSNLSVFDDLSSDVSERLRDISLYLNGEGNKISSSGDFASRSDYYEKSVDIFLEYPIVGCTFVGGHGTEVGGHSFILDYLAMFGLFGCITIGLYFTSLYKNLYGVFKDTPKVYYNLVFIYAAMILLSFYNFDLWYESACVFIPLAALLCKQKLAKI